MDEAPLIRASELAQYHFCQRAWWLASVKGYRPEDQTALVRGSQTHQRHTRQVRAALRWRRAGFWLIASGIFFLISVLLWLLARPNF